MEMNKKPISAILAAAMAFSMAACSGQTTSSTSQTTSASTGSNQSGDKTVVEIWTNDRHDLDYVKSKIEEFNATNPDNIEIQQTVVTDDYFNMLTMARSSGTAPDLAFLNGGASGFDLKLFADSGIVQPLNSFIDSAPEELERNTDCSKHIFEGLNALDGNIYWIPTVKRSATCVLYNKTLTEEASMTEFPTTLDGMVELAEKISENGNGKYYGYASTSSDPFVRCFMGVSERSGQNQFGYDYVNGKFDFSGFKPVVEGFKKLFTGSGMLPGSATQQVDAMRAQFAEGTVGMWPNASQEAGVFTNQFPIDSFEWGVASMPSIDGEIHGAETAQPQKGLIMLGDTDVPEEAWKVIEFFASEDFIKGYIESGFALPFSDYMMENTDLSKAGRIGDFGKNEYESVYPNPPTVTVEGENYKTVLISAAMGERDIDEAIQDLNTRYNQALERDIQMGKVKRLVIKDFDPLHPSEGTVEYLDK